MKQNIIIIGYSGGLTTELFHGRILNRLCEDGLQVHNAGFIEADGSAVPVVGTREAVVALLAGVNPAEGDLKALLQEWMKATDVRDNEAIKQFIGLLDSMLAEVKATNAKIDEFVTYERKDDLTQTRKRQPKVVKPGPFGNVPDTGKGVSETTIIQNAKAEPEKKEGAGGDGKTLAPVGAQTGGAAASASQQNTTNMDNTDPNATTAEAGTTTTETPAPAEAGNAAEGTAVTGGGEAETAAVEGGTTAAE
jgi:hypothetical protein